MIHPSTQITRAAMGIKLAAVAVCSLSACLWEPSDGIAQELRPSSAAPTQIAPTGPVKNDPFRSGDFRWRVSPPLIAVDPARMPESSQHPWLAIKDPSVVRYQGRWHLFCTLRKAKEGDGRIRIGYLSFVDWADASDADWSVLDLTMGYHGAPQIFYFRPHKKWYLIYQATDETRNLKYGPCYSTNGDISKPNNWTRPEPLYVVKENAKAGLDYWLICDEEKAHLFFTTLNGQMWRAETAKQDFPNQGWTDPEIVLQADIFEASHTYKLKDQKQFLTIVEAQAGKRRYFKAFTTKSLDRKWTPLAASRDQPFVSPTNVVNQNEAWATSYSHGELIRDGSSETMQIDPAELRLLFQGANDDQYQSGNYGQIPWRLGILELQGSEK